MNSLIRYLLWGVGLGVIGWISHPWFLDISCPPEKIRIVSQSIQQLFGHKIISTASFVVLGIAFAACSPRVGRWVPLLIINAVAAIIFWLWLIRYRIEKIYDNVSGSTNLKAFDINIDAIPLYEVGLVAALLVLLTTGIVFLSKKKNGA